MVVTCPHCGSMLHEPSIFTGAKRRILEFIRTHPGCTIEDIMSGVYANNHEGGPNPNIVHVYLHKMRPVLAANGLRIVNPRGPGATYTLVKDPQNGPSL